jgi:hypothetical protein
VYHDWSKVVNNFSYNSDNDIIAVQRRLYVRTAHLLKYVDGDADIQRIARDMQAALLGNGKLAKRLKKLRKKNPGWWQQLENPNVVVIPEKRVQSPSKARK